MSRVSVRMYRLGVGDCFLLRFPRPDGGVFKMLIDCGVHQSQSGGADRIRNAVDDLLDVTDGHLDVVVATHEHWDHISGFTQADDQFAEATADEIWFAWTEDDDDPLAKKLALGNKRYRAIYALTGAEARMRLNGIDTEGDRMAGLLGFYGPGAGVNLKKAGDVLKSLSKEKRYRYRRPGEPPIELPGNDARIFVLGPPRNEALIARDAPRKHSGEVYEFGAYGAALDALEPAIGRRTEEPFDSRFAIPLEGTEALPFFQKHYWAARAPDPPESDREDTTQSWRRIDRDWLGAATSLALKLDEDTNNTSLVLAIELGKPDTNGQVLLFAADAQVGNWMSWQTVEWADYNGRHITGPDLLRRTVLYKVGHHASHNATLRENGLETMDSLKLTLVTTDAEMAAKVKWGTLPWPPLLDRLNEKTGNRVIRTDHDLQREIDDFEVIEKDLYYEIRM